jgi:hypothetical protein
LVRTTNPGDPVTFTLQVANDNLQRSNAALVKRIEALEARLKAANNNHAAGPKALKTAFRGLQGRASVGGAKAGLLPVTDTPRQRRPVRPFGT